MKNIIILILLFGGHFLADFTPLSSMWMLKAKRYGKPLFPIFCHGLMHGIFTFIILLFSECRIMEILMLTGVMTISHFVIDVWKGRLTAAYSKFQNTQNKSYWWLMGFDQYLHAIVIIIIYIQI